MTRVWLSVDVEPDIAEYVSHSSQGILEGLPRLLELFDDLSTPVDFFVIGESARRNPDLLRGISDHGYSIGSHGDSHRLLCLSSLDEQRESIRRSVLAISELTNKPVKFFRAPNFSADGNTIRVLEELGIPLDSSVLPGRTLTRWRFLKVYDHRRAPRTLYTPSKSDIDSAASGQVTEVPVTENPLQPGTPIGLGYLNSHSVQATLDAMKASRGDYATFLIHPWEAVDLAEAFPHLPRWVSRACSSNLTPLRTFLTELGKSQTFVSAAALVPSVKLHEDTFFR